MKYRLSWLIGSAAAALLMIPGTVPALVVTNGCVQVGSCTMQELLDGGSITVDDKLFSGFSAYASSYNPGLGNPFAGMPITADNIRVYSQADKLGASGVAGEIGLAFNIGIGNPNQLALLDPGQSLSMHWEYLVTVLNPTLAIVDNTLLFPSGIVDGATVNSIASTSEGASLSVTEQVLDPDTGQGIVRKFIQANENGTAVSDHRDFAPMSALQVVTDINGFGGTGSGTSVSLDWVVQSFSQATIPEPSTAALLLAALLLVPAARRWRT